MAKKKKQPGPMYHLNKPSGNAKRCKLVTRGQGASKPKSVRLSQEELDQLAERLQAKGMQL